VHGVEEKFRTEYPTLPLKGGRIFIFMNKEKTNAV
jgi:hypothetical protein